MTNQQPTQAEVVAVLLEACRETRETLHVAVRCGLRGFSEKERDEIVEGYYSTIRMLTRAIDLAQSVPVPEVVTPVPNEELARAFRQQSRSGDGAPEGTQESLERCARMLNEHAPDMFPANDKGQIHMARAMMESVTDEISAYFAKTPATVPEEFIEYGVMLVNFDGSESGHSIRWREWDKAAAFGEQEVKAKRACGFRIFREAAV